MLRTIYTPAAWLLLFSCFLNPTWVHAQDAQDGEEEKPENTSKITLDAITQISKALDKLKKNSDFKRQNAIEKVIEEFRDQTREYVSSVRNQTVLNTERKTEIAVMRAIEALKGVPLDQREPLKEDLEKIQVEVKKNEGHSTFNGVYPVSSFLGAVIASINTSATSEKLSEDRNKAKIKAQNTDNGAEADFSNWVVLQSPTNPDLAKHLISIDRLIQNTWNDRKSCPTPEMIKKLEAKLNAELDQLKKQAGKNPMKITELETRLEKLHECEKGLAESDEKIRSADLNEIEFPNYPKTADSEETKEIEENLQKIDQALKPKDNSKTIFETPLRNWESAKKQGSAE